MENADLFAGSAERKEARQAASAQRQNLGTFQQYKAQGGTLDRAGFEEIGGGNRVQNIFSGVSGLFRKKGN